MGGTFFIGLLLGIIAGGSFVISYYYPKTRLLKSTIQSLSQEISGIKNEINKHEIVNVPKNGEDETIISVPIENIDLMIKDNEIRVLQRKLTISEDNVNNLKDINKELEAQLQSKNLEIDALKNG